MVKADKMAFIVFGFVRQNGTYCEILSFIIIRTKYSVIASGIRGPRGILCTRGEKEYASIRQSIVACGNRLVKNEAYDASPGRDTK